MTSPFNVTVASAIPLASVISHSIKNPPIVSPSESVWSGVNIITGGSTSGVINASILAKILSQSPSNSACNSTFVTQEVVNLGLISELSLSYAVSSSFLATCLFRTVNLSPITNFLIQAGFFQELRGLSLIFSFSALISSIILAVSESSPLSAGIFLPSGFL